MGVFDDLFKEEEEKENTSGTITLPKTQSKGEFFDLFADDLEREKQEQEKRDEEEKDRIAERAAQKQALIEYEQNKGAKEGYSGGFLGLGGLWDRGVDIVSGDTPQDRARRIKEYEGIDPASEDKLPEVKVKKTDAEKGARASYSSNPFMQALEMGVDLVSGDTPQDRYRRIQDEKEKEMQERLPESATQYGVDQYIRSEGLKDVRKLKSEGKIDSAEVDRRVKEIMEKNNQEQIDIMVKAWRKTKINEAGDKYRAGDINEAQLNAIVSSITSSYEDLPDFSLLPTEARSGWQQAVLPGVGAAVGMVGRLPSNVAGVAAGAGETFTPFDNLFKPIREAAVKQSAGVSDFLEYTSLAQGTRPGENRFATQLSSGAGSLAVSIGTAAATGGTSIPAVLFGLDAAGRQMYGSQEAGKSGVEVFTTGLTGGVVEGSLESFGLGKFMKVGGKPARRLVTRAITEGLQEFAQEGSEAVIRNKYEDVDFQEAYVNASSALGYGMILGGGGDIVLRNNVMKQSEQQAKKSLMDAGMMEADAAAEATRLREVAEEEFQETIESDQLAELQEQLRTPIEETVKEVDQVKVREKAKKEFEPVQKKLEEEGKVPTETEVETEPVAPTTEKKAEPKTPESTVDTTYRGKHKAPVKTDDDTNVAGFELEKMFGEEIYSPQAAQYYGHGDTKLDQGTADILWAWRGNPNKKVKVFRAVPKGTEGEVNKGDWVSPNREYAVEHGESRLKGEYDIQEITTTPSELFTDGNSIHEFGYDPKTKPKKTKDKAPEGYGVQEATKTKKPKVQKLKGESMDDAIAREVGYQVDNGIVKIEDTPNGLKATLAIGDGKPQVLAGFINKKELNAEIWKRLNPEYGVVEETKQPTVRKVGDTDKPSTNFIGETRAVKKGNKRPNTLTSKSGITIQLPQYNPNVKSDSAISRQKNQWDMTLVEAAIEEAKANNDSMNLAIFEGMKESGAKNLSKSDVDSVHLYLFGTIDSIKLDYGEQETTTPPVESKTKTKSKPSPTKSKQVTEKKMIQLVKGVIPRTTALPVLQRIAIKGKDVIATDLETMVVYHSDKDYGKNIVIDKKVVTERGIEGAIEAAARTEDISEDIDVYPEVLKVEKSVGNIESAKLGEALKVAEFVSKDETRLPLTGVYIEVKDGMMYMTATDSYHLMTTSTETNLEDGTYLLDGNSAKQLAKIIKATGDNTVDVFTGENAMRFVVGDFEIIGREIQDQFPKWRTLYDGYKFNKAVKISPDTLMEVAKVAERKEFGAGILFEFDGNKLKLNYTDKTGVNESKTITTTEAPITIGEEHALVMPLKAETGEAGMKINGEYIEDSLKAFGGDVVLVMDTTNGMNPILMQKPGVAKHSELNVTKPKAVTTNGDRAVDLGVVDKRTDFARAKSPDDLKKLIKQLNQVGMKNAILRRGQLKAKKETRGMFSYKKTKSRTNPEGDPTAAVKLQDEVIQDEQQYLTVLAHELAHAIEYNLMGTTRGKTLKMLGATDKTTEDKMRAELIAISEHIEGVKLESLDAKRQAYLKKPTEGWARFIETYLIENTSAREIAPTVYEGFEKLIVKEQMARDLHDAIMDNMDKNWVNKTPAFLKDRRQIYQKHLGKSAGKQAYDAEIVRRAKIGQAQVKIDQLIKEKFKKIKDSGEALFRAAEAIDITSEGEVSYGTNDYLEVSNEQEMADAEEAGFEFSHKAMDFEGNPIAVYKKTRYTEKQARQMLNELSDKGRELILEFNAAKVDAKDEFNRQVIKDMYDIESNLEGWVHHYFKDSKVAKNTKAPLKNKVASAKKKRRGAEGYIEDFRTATHKALLELETAKINNAFILKQLARVSKPIAKGQDPDQGWTEVIWDKKYGLRLPGESQQSVKTKTVLGDEDMGSIVAGSEIVLSETSYMKPVHRYQVPTQLAEHYRNIRSIPQEINKITRTLNLIGKYWNINVLTHPGTTGTNFISGGLQYTGKIFNDFYMDLLTFDPTFSQTRADLIAPFMAITPRGFSRAPNWLWGGYRSNLYGQLAKESKVNSRLDKYGNTVLKGFSAVENYWKRVITISEGVDLKEARNGKIAREMTKQEETMIAAVNDVVDLWAYDYDNAPIWMDQFARKGGNLIKPFMKYPYKYSKMLSNLAVGAFDRSLPWQERMSKALTLGTIMFAIQSAASAFGEPETPEGDERTPYALRSRGRQFLGTLGGDELFLRTTKYPFLNVHAAGKNLIKGNYKEVKDLTNELFASTGIGFELFALATGYGTEFDKYKSVQARLGETAQTLIPMFRIMGDVSRALDTDPDGNAVSRKYDTFLQGLFQPIPIFGSEETRTKLKGEPRTIRIPNEPETRSISDDPGTESRLRTREPWQIWLSMVTGVYTSKIDPEEAKRQELRNLRNTAEDQVRELLKRHQWQDAEMVAEEYGLTISTRNIDYYRRNYNSDGSSKND